LRHLLPKHQSSLQLHHLSPSLPSSSRPSSLLRRLLPKHQSSLQLHHLSPSCQSRQSRPSSLRSSQLHQLLPSSLR
jgi:hypothetical protein